MKPAPLALLGLVPLPLAVGAFVLGSGDAASPVSVSVPVVATDYALAAPDTLRAGAVTFRLTNRGKEFHHLWVARLEPGKTGDDLMAAIRTTGHLPAWAHGVGGPNAPRPEGGEANATVVLTPGSYVLACVIPSPDGTPHFMKGMMRPLTVVGTGTPAGAPSADLTMTLREFSFVLSGPLTAGEQVIEVRNEGEQVHEIELVRLAPGKSVPEVLAWIEKPAGAPPGLPIGGVSPIERGSSAWFTVNLEPGRYGVICFLPDSGDRKPHFAHGMIQELEVGPGVAAR